MINLNCLIPPPTSSVTLVGDEVQMRRQEIDRKHRKRSPGDERFSVVSDTVVGCQTRRSEARYLPKCMPSQ